jgi:hypothetical protein
MTLVEVFFDRSRLYGAPPDPRVAVAPVHDAQAV